MTRFLYLWRKIRPFASSVNPKVRCRCHDITDPAVYQLYVLSGFRFHRCYDLHSRQDIHLGVLPLRSKDNPADEPSREKRVRRADPAAAPDWARNFIAGDITAIDCILPVDPRLQWCCSPQVGKAFAEYDLGAS